MFKHSIDIHSLPYLKKSYSTFLDKVNESSITVHCERISGINVAGELFGSSGTRKSRSGFILAAWCGVNGRIDTSGTKVRPGVVTHFIRQNVEVDGCMETCILAEVRWFQVHPRRDALGAPLQVWCNNHYEIEGPADFIPLQRIHAKFVPAIQVLNNENVLVVCPLPRKLQC
ncbi:uncharacterized protein LOC116296474 [Actinia tenebrosa]|uniref:Uncharacterized protein LOC116296474 n=1 Tax=Actinia tenebrosa TaxID=6105 RepID=A0A6P8HY99_ACTTE|nr:uncharacterized protein LOC116296474 [Actinia tenebrosa]